MEIQWSEWLNDHKIHEYFLQNYEYHDQGNHDHDRHTIETWNSVDSIRIHKINKIWVFMSMIWLWVNISQQ